MKAVTAIAIVQARMGSSRLAGKVLADLGGRPVLDWVVRAARATPAVDKVVVATSDQSGDDPIADWCDKNDVACFRGPETDVLRRFALAAEAEAATCVMRITADCPLLDPQVCGAVLALFRRERADYATNADPPSWPDGLDCEVFSAAALADADQHARRPSEREHVGLYIRHRRNRFRVVTLTCPLPRLTGERWTLDTEADLTFLRRLVEELPPARNAGTPPSYVEVLNLLDALPGLRRFNAGQIRNEGGRKSVLNEYAERWARRDRKAFATSWRMLPRCEKVIPLATQTFSKAYTQMPRNRAPLFLSHGRGGRVWDVDGNDYVDLVCGLMPVVLGYADPDVDAAIRDQITRGICFSLATSLEVELAERLVEIIPCAEMVRFGKNGSDATSAAVRLARAHTGRDRVAVCGYHGWHDWYIGSTTRNKGVPRALRAITHRFPYDDLPALDRVLRAHRGDFAAVVIEPVIASEPQNGYLQGVVEAARHHGALVIFDEIKTGFRLHLGGAQARYGVTPDLACLGKAMGNGMPISAVVGCAEVMREFEEVFVSGTFGGEALSLAAAIAVIDKMRREPVIETLWRTGQEIADGVEKSIAAYDLANVLSLIGAPPSKVIQINDHPTASSAAIRTLFKREMLAGGVLVSGSHNVCYAHSAADTAQVLAVYDRTLRTIAEELARGALESRLACPPIQPIFAIADAV